MGAPVSYGAAAQGGVGRSKGALSKGTRPISYWLSPKSEPRDLVPPALGHRLVLLLHEGEAPGAFGTRSTAEQRLSRGLSVPCVQGCGPGNRWWHQSTARLLHLESCDLGPLRSGLRGRRPGPAQSPCRGPQERAMLLGEHRWGDTWLRNGGGRKLCLGAGTCPIHGLVAKYRRVSG